MSRALLLLCVLAGCGGGATPDGGGVLPNVVLIVADDLGWNDVGYQGGSIPTPHIDRIATEGLALGRFYTAVNCSPTRMGLFTGRYPIRWGLMNTVVRPWDARGLPPEETTLAELFGGLGYEHRALIGKWHLGCASRDLHPLRQGFTRFQGHYTGYIDYFDHTREGERDWHRDFEPFEEQGYSTDLIADAAVRFVREHASAGPFLLCVAFNAPHFPPQAPAAYVERFGGVADERRRVYAAMVSCMDDGVGRIRAALDEAGVGDDTILWFLSDNGGAPAWGASNAPLRGEKSTVFDGGIRVPSAVRWPRGGLTGGRTVEELVAYVDVLPTLLAAAGTDASPPRPLDGVDVLDVLRGRASEPERDLFAYASLRTGQAATGGEGLAVTTRDWKLVRFGPRFDRDPDGERSALALFRIREDPGETANVADEHPAVVQELLGRLRAFRALRPADAGEASPSEPPAGWSPPPRWRVPE